MHLLTSTRSSNVKYIFFVLKKGMFFSARAQRILSYQLGFKKRSIFLNAEIQKESSSIVYSTQSKKV